ncbi:alpha/beta fold hydrolase [Shewanella surugensis]|uniref:Alpha/beta hydrolase n=1 Tax=Shewanella surugensis TaxID=212020 RepID=A0ABT0LJ82_9GAMM|nr:alpha/beta hydrolase [Shewanella surugensis]MCL1127768.1 alpha/beta hydrolase [Shewanella surugensis]
MAVISPYSHYFITNDGAQLHYLDKGQGPTLLMLPTWNISCEVFKYQFDDLSSQYRILTLDMRGHGLSQKVTHGYKVHRLAKDLHEFIEHLQLKELILLGHNFGATIICCYLELFGSSPLSKLIFIDRAATPMMNPIWNQTEIQNYGPTSDPKSIDQLCDQIASSQDDHFMKVFSNCMLSKSASDEKRQLLLDNSDTLPKKAAASLLYDAFYQDWRSLFPKITLPTLVIGGRASLISASSQYWTSQQIPNAKLVIFEEHEGGKHFPFIENPSYFNQVINNFIQSS